MPETVISGWGDKINGGVFTGNVSNLLKKEWFVIGIQMKFGNEFGRQLGLSSVSPGLSIIINHHEICRNNFTLRPICRASKNRIIFYSRTLLKMPL
jgi:hypothetical protein